MPSKVRRHLRLPMLTAIGLVGTSIWYFRPKAEEPTVVKAIPVTVAKIEEAASPAAAIPAPAPAPEISLPVVKAPEPPPPPAPEPVSAPDRYEGKPVIAERQIPPSDQPRVRWEVTKLIRDESFKYPLVRVIEQWQVGSKGPVRVQQSAMVADHVMLKLQPNARIEDLLAQVSALHPFVRKFMPASKAYLIAFEDPSLDTVPQALERLRRVGQLIAYVEPDYLAHTMGK